MQQIGTAHRVKIGEARRHFEAGGAIAVSDQGHEESFGVYPITVTHDKSRTEWQALRAEVAMWRNRYPNQRFYVAMTYTLRQIAEQIKREGRQPKLAAHVLELAVKSEQARRMR